MVCPITQGDHKKYTENKKHNKLTENKQTGPCQKCRKCTSVNLIEQSELCERVMYTLSTLLLRNTAENS